MRRSLNLVLASLGLVPDADQRAAIEACRSTEILERWIARAPTVASVAELLEA